MLAADDNSACRAEREDGMLHVAAGEGRKRAGQVAQVRTASMPKTTAGWC